MCGVQYLSRDEDVIEKRYNNYSEAMFWGCFSYNSKGPCHVYYKETPEQKLHYEELMGKLNEEEIEAEGREQFALEQAELAEKWKEKGRKKPGKAATWENFWKGYTVK
jgi:hypothetical protein